VLLLSHLHPRGRCDEARNGLEAVEAYAASIRDQERYHVVFMDIMMPEMDGLTATRKIRTLEQAFKVPEDARARIVMVSCLDDPTHIIQAQFESGADAYMTKPYEAALLDETLRNLDLLPNPLPRSDRDGEHTPEAE
jgi:two-component system chemotaxis response regulator CheY